MTSPRARWIQYTVVTVTAVLGLAALAYGIGAVQIGGATVLRSTTIRTFAGVVGGAFLLSAAVAFLSPWWRRTQAKFFFSISLFVALLAAAEVAARMAGYPAEPNHPRDTCLLADQETGFVWQPNSRFRYLSAKGWVEGTTDAAGYRPSISGVDDPRRPAIVCVGDSTTFSCEVEDGQTWPEAAGRDLAVRGRPHRMINRGIPGYSGLQSLLTLRRTLAGPADVRAVVYYFCCNDPEENFSGGVPSPLLRAAGDGFEIVPPSQPWMAQIGWLELKPRSALQTAFRTWRFRTNDSAYWMGGYAHYLYICNRNRNFVEKQPLRDGMRFVLEGMKAECDRRSIPLFVSSVCYPFFDRGGRSREEMATLCGMPSDTIAEDSRSYDAACEQLRKLVEGAGAHFLDIRGCLDGMSYREYAASPYDWHFSAAANERIGKTMAAKLASHLK